MAPPDAYLEWACQPYIVKCCFLMMPFIVLLWTVLLFEGAIHHLFETLLRCSHFWAKIVALLLLLLLCPAMGHQLVSDVLRRHNTGFVCLACYCHVVYSARVVPPCRGVCNNPGSAAA